MPSDVTTAFDSRNSTPRSIHAQQQCQADSSSKRASQTSKEFWSTEELISLFGVGFVQYSWRLRLSKAYLLHLGKSLTRPLSLYLISILQDAATESLDLAELQDVVSGFSPSFCSLPYSQQHGLLLQLVKQVSKVSTSHVCFVPSEMTLRSRPNSTRVVIVPVSRGHITCSSHSSAY